MPDPGDRTCVAPASGHDPRRDGPALSWPVLLVLAAILGFGLLGSRGLWDPDEGRYAEVAREMMQSGDWLHPRLHGHPHYSKPPLTYWSIAAGMTLFGQNEWGVRFYLGVAVASTILLLAAFGQSLTGSARGRWAGPIWGTMLFPFGAGSAATSDTLLVALQVSALWAFWLHWNDPAPGRRWPPLLLWTSLGLAFLTKGPPALLPLGVMVLFAALARRDALRSRWSWVRWEGLVVFVLIGLSWYLVVVQTTPGLLRYFLKDEVVGRAVSDSFNRNPHWYKPFTLYLPILTLGLLPWSAAWPWSLHRLSLHGDPRSRPRFLLLALWIVPPLVLFSLIPSRQPLYVLPVVPALALATTLGLSGGWARRLPRLVGFAAVALLALRLFAAASDWPRDSRAFAEDLRSALGDRPAEIVMVNDKLHGVEFYLGRPVQLVEQPTARAPRFARLDELEEEIVELSLGSYRHVFVVREQQVDELLSQLELLTDAEVTRVLERGKLVALAVDPARAPEAVRRILVVWNRPGSDGKRAAAPETLEEWVEILAPSEIVILYRASPRSKFAGTDDQTRDYWRLREFGKPVRSVAIPRGEKAFDIAPGVRGRLVGERIEVVTDRGGGLGDLAPTRALATVRFDVDGPVFESLNGRPGGS